MLPLVEPEPDAEFVAGAVVVVDEPSPVVPPVPVVVWVGDVVGGAVVVVVPGSLVAGADVVGAELIVCVGVAPWAKTTLPEIEGLDWSTEKSP